MCNKSINIMMYSIKHSHERLQTLISNKIHIL